MNSTKSYFGLVLASVADQQSFEVLGDVMFSIFNSTIKSMALAEGYQSAEYQEFCHRFHASNGSEESRAIARFYDSLGPNEHPVYWPITFWENESLDSTLVKGIIAALNKITPDQGVSRIQLLVMPEEVRRAQVAAEMQQSLANFEKEQEERRATSKMVAEIKRRLDELDESQSTE